MANPNNPFGFRPIARLGGAPYSVTEYAKPSADSNAIFAFDLAIYQTGTPLALPENPNFNLPRIQTGYQATPGTTLWLGASLAYGAASVGSVHPVTDEPDVIYLTQAKTGTVISTATHVHKNAQVAITTAGSTTTKQSGMMLDSATITGSGSGAYDLRIQKVAMISGNAEGDSAILEVTINKHAMGLQTAGL